MAFCLLNLYKIRKKKYPIKNSKKTIIINKFCFFFVMVKNCNYFSEILLKIHIKSQYIIIKS